MITLNDIKIDGTMVSSEYHKEAGYKVECKGIKFFSPFSCFSSYILGEGAGDYRSKINDDRYNEIKACILEKVIPYVCKTGRKTLSSYTLKHGLEQELGGYVSNETVKIIMIELGVPTRKSKYEYSINILYPYSGVLPLESRPKTVRNRLFSQRR